MAIYNKVSRLLNFDCGISHILQVQILDFCQKIGTAIAKAAICSKSLTKMNDVICHILPCLSVSCMCFCKLESPNGFKKNEYAGHLTDLWQGNDLMD